MTDSPEPLIPARPLRHTFSIVADQAELDLIAAAARKEGVKSRSRWIVRAAVARALAVLDPPAAA